MAHIFISHSSRNNDKAIEVRDWLAANGWTDVFLDLDPERGIVAGQRWKEALQKAACRCEVVLALVSPEWLASGWCKTEIDAARLMGKKVIVALVGTDKAQVPVDLTDEQFIDLSADPQAYPRLKAGLKRAGLDPTSFPFDPKRPPYPGLACLEEQDAAIFFGRDAQIVRGLDEIRRLVRTGITRMLVVLGASGSGKSSFLRAGLWPRLKRDDRAWLPLPILRPERAAISGKYGLAKALHQVMSEPRFAGGIRQRGLPQSRADIQDFLEKTDDGLEKLFAALRDIAQAAALSDETAAPPTILLALDQGEELFNEEGREEARRFIEILTKTLSADHPHALAILAMRSDSFPLVQVDPRLAALRKDTFTLDMMLEGSYRAVIEGPARLVEPPLRIDPQLTDALLKDISGQDALPLLAFTLAYLHEHYAAADNALTLAGYDKIGRVTGVIDKTVAQAFAEAVARGEAPKDKDAQLALARSAFIPHLAQVNAAGQAVRRVTAREKIPAEARALIDRFADQRLLIKDRRKDAEGHDVDVVEVAHEALLRQPPFSRWLEDDREFLVWRERLSQARADFEDKQRGLLAGRELEIARGWMQARAEHEIEPADQAFIRESIAADDKRRAEEAAQRKRRQRLLVGALVVFALLAVAASGAAIFAFKAEQTAKEQQAKASKAASQANVSLALNSHANGNDNQELAYLAKALRLNGRNSEAGARTAALLTQESWPVVTGAMKHDGAVTSAQFSADGQRVVTASNQTAQVWDVATGKALGEPMKHDGRILSAQFSPDGQRVVTASEDWTARVWDAATGTALGEPMKHDGAVRSAQFSADGQRVLTASEDGTAHGTARVWDAANGKALGEPIKHDGAVLSAQFSPDGQRVVTASDDGTARVWDVATGKALGEPMKLDGQVLQFSPDGQRVVTASEDGTARVWEAATGKALGEPMKHNGEVRSAQFSPDGQRVVTASEDGTARVWEAATGKALGEPMKHNGEVRSAQFSPDGQRVVTASEDGTARVWEAATGKALGKPMKHDGAVNSAQFSPDGQRVVTASDDGTARVWDVATGKALSEPMKHDGQVLQFSADGQRVVTASNQTARVWDAATGKALGEPMKHADRVWSAQFSADGQRVVTASWDKTARVWDAATGKALGEPMKHADAVNSAQFSADGQRVVTASFDKTARVWDAATGKALCEPMKHDDKVNSAQFSPDGQRVVTASFDQTAQVWDAATGKAIGEPMKHDGEVNSAQFSADGQRVVTASDDRTARVWVAATGKALGEPMKHDDKVYSAQFSADGQRVVTASFDKTARVWDAATGKALGEPMKHDDKVISAQFSPDGQRVLTASNDGTARVWDAATGKAIGEPMKHDGAVNSAQFSPDGQRVLTASEDGTARVWDVPTITTKDSADDVNLLSDLAEATAGLAFQAFGQTEILAALTPDQVKATRDRIAVKFSGSFSTLTPLQRLLKWSVANPRTRPISPFSDLTVADWVNNRIKEGRLDDLRDAMLVDPANARLAAHFGLALANFAIATDPDDARRARAEADFQARRAVKLAPYNDNADAMNQLGELYYYGRGVAQDYAQAREWYQKAADAGNTNAMTSLGWLYANGQGVTQDYQKARELYQKAADAGNAFAMNSLGWLYANGQGVTQDYQKARELYQKAGGAGNTNAMTNLGYLYANGQGVTQDYQKASELYQKAVDAGNTNAMANLGWLYANGQGITQDYQKARELYQKAAYAGNAWAKNALLRLP